MSVFDKATEAAFFAQQQARGVSATYQVDATTTISDMTIVPAETTRDSLGDDGVVMSIRSKDWLIKVSDLLGNEPKRSHKITVNSEEFELVQVDNEKAFRFHNPPTNSIYRVHTNLTSGSAG